MRPPPIPDWLISVASDTSVRRPPPGKARSIHSVFPRERVNGSEAAYARAAFDGELSELAAMAPDSGRNNMLARASYALAGLLWVGAFDEAELRARLLEACRCNRLISDDGERSVMATMEGQIREGSARPRKIPPEGGVADSPPLRPAGLAQEPEKTGGYTQHLETSVAVSAGLPQGQREPALLVIRDWALDLGDVEGPGLAWRDGNRAFASRWGRMVGTSEFVNGTGLETLSHLAERSAELAYVHRVKKASDREQMVIRVWRTWAPVAFQAVMNELPDRASLEDAAVPGEALGVDRLMAKALSADIRVSDHRHEAPYHTSIIQEALACRSVSWQQVGRRRAYVRENVQMAICHDAFLAIQPMVEDVLNGRKALSRELKKLSIAESKSIRVGEEIFRAYVLCNDWIKNRFGIGEDV